MKLKVLSVRDIERPARVPVGEVRDHAAHGRCQRAVGRSHPHHEVADRVAAHASAVALGVQPPSPQPDREIVGRNALESLARVPPDVVEDGPGWSFALDAFDVLRR